MKIKNLKIFSFWIMFLTISTYATAQDDKNGYLIKSNFLFGLSSHSNKPIQFPLGYSDTWITPKSQDSRLGYQASLIFLKEINKILLTGLSGNFSKFGFVEKGTELSFWTGMEGEQTTLREFEMYSFGVIAGINILKTDLNKFSTYIGFRYEELISTEGLYLRDEDDNRDKFASEILIEYGHKLSKRVNLTIGLNSVMSLTDFFEYIGYRPIRYGVSLGIEYELK